MGSGVESLRADVLVPASCRWLRKDLTDLDFCSAGRPYPPTNCTLTNATADWLRVECLESFNSGLPQGFQLELLELPHLVPR